MSRKPLPSPPQDDRPRVAISGPASTLEQAMAADPTLCARLEAAGRWHRIDSAWAFGSVRTSLEDPTGHPWRVEQEAAIQEIRATAAGTKRRKAGP